MKKLNLFLILLLLVSLLFSCTTPNNNDNPDPDEEIVVDGLLDNSELNVYIWASGTVNTYFKEKEIQFIKTNFHKKLKHPELIHYYIVYNTLVADFGVIVNDNGNADVILAAGNMDKEEGANIKIKTDEECGKIAFDASYYSSENPRYMGISENIDSSKLATAKCLRETVTTKKEELPQYKVLFIGNSYTYYNDLYLMYEGVLANQNIEIDSTVLAKGSAFLSDYATSGKYNEELMTILDNNQFDLIYLQEQSSKAAKNYSGFLNSAKDLASIISRTQGHAKICLYGTWARDERNSFYTENPSYTYRSMTYAVADNYHMVSNVLNCDLAYCGLGFYEIYTNHKDIELYQPDYTHPSPRGSYLVSLCLAKTSFNINPNDVTYLPSYVTTIGTDKVMPTVEEANLIKTIVNNISYL